MNFRLVLADVTAEELADVCEAFGGGARVEHSGPGFRVTTTACTDAAWLATQLETLARHSLDRATRCVDGCLHRAAGHVHAHCVTGIERDLDGVGSTTITAADVAVMGPP